MSVLHPKLFSFTYATYPLPTILKCACYMTYITLYVSSLTAILGL